MLTIIGIVSVAIVLTLFAFFWFFKQDSSNTQSSDINSSAISDIKVRRVFIEGLYALEPPINTEMIGIIERSLYTNVNQGVSDLYTGTIRPGSYSATSSSDGKKIISMMVDVEPVTMTYLVTAWEFQGSRSIDILCAPKEFQLNQSIICKESIWT